MRHMEPGEAKDAVLEGPAEGHANAGRAEHPPPSPAGVSEEQPAPSSDADPPGTGMGIPPGGAPGGPAEKKAHPAGAVNGATRSDLQGAAPPLNHAPSCSLGPPSDSHPPADTSGQAPAVGHLGAEQATSDGAPSGASGGSRPRHHLLRHTLPPDLSGLNAVRHFGVDGVAPALRLVQTMSQRELQQAFEKVYNVKSSSNNNNWLRKKLVEALVPRENSNDPEVDGILEELASRSGARKRQKEWAGGAGGGVEGWRGHHMPPQLNPYAPYPTAALAAAQAAQAAAAAAAAAPPPANQRKASKVRPSPTDAEGGYGQVEWDAPAEEVTAAGRKKRRAAAGVAAATAAVLRDPALEEIEKADLRRAAMGDQERRWGTGNGGNGGRGGGAAWRNGRARADRAGDVAPAGDAAGGQDLATMMQSLTHLMSIAVQQGKLAPPGVAGGLGPGAAPGLGALGALAAQAAQGQYYGQPQPAAPQFTFGGQAAGGQAAGLAGALAALIQQQQAQAAVAAAAQHPDAWMGGVGGFGGARPAAPAPAAPAPVAPALAAGTPSASEQHSVLARLLASMAQDPSRTPEQLQQLRAMAAQASRGAPPAAPAPAPPAAADPQRAAAAATLQQVLAARIAQLRSAGQAEGQACAAGEPRQASTDAPHAPAGPPAEASIPGSNYPVDSMLMQLLQQQRQAAAAAQQTATAAPAEQPKGGQA